MSPAEGRTLGPYQMVSLLGAGGMGEVFRAHDPRVGRDVAVKVSAEDFSDRFARESRAVAALNHPNICALYDVGPNYLVMELVEGESLKARLKSGALDQTEALHIARQIADALDAAHERGVVHRDLKPANIMIRSDGTVKVLDFGVAKMAQPDPGPPQDALTRPMDLTQEGMVVGTAAYMSPEQSRGSDVDKRTDIWAFGVVLHEMLTGDPLFTGATLSDIRAAVLTRNLDLSKVPSVARPLLTRCLERDPRRRLRDIGEARFLLETSPVVPATIPSTTRKLPWAVAALLAIALAVAVVLLWNGPRGAPLSTLRLNVDLGPLAVDGVMPALSPDGERLVFVARAPDGTNHLLLRRLDTAQDDPLPGTEGAASPFFSADDRWIGFFAGGQLRKISAQGGGVATITTVGGPSGASWGEDGTIVMGGGNAGGLMRVPPGGGKPEPLTRTGERGDATHRYPQILPGAKTALFTSHKIVTGFDDATIEAVSIATGERKVVMRGGYFGRYIPGDIPVLLYIHDGVLFAVRFDLGTLEVRGTPVPVLEEVAGNAGTAAGNFDVASGTLIYRRGKGPVRTWQVLALDESGKREPLLSQAGTYYTPSFSPDGARLALAVDYGDRGREIAVYDLQRGSLERRTYTKEVNLFPVWSPDGKYLAFESSSPTGYGIAMIRADGGGTLIRTLENAGLMIPGSFSPDGRTLAYHESQAETGFDIWTVTVDRSDPEHPQFGKPTVFQRTPTGESSPIFSPDGHWIAYNSSESGRGEVYVRPFPGPGGQSSVSVNGGNNALWSPDGRQLYFRAPDARIMVTDCTVQKDTLVFGKPRVWADTQVGQTAFGRDMSLSPRDGRFAVLSRVTPPTPEGSAHLTFVVNFLEDLRRRVK